MTRPLPPALGIASVVQLLHRLREYGLRLSSIRTAVEERLVSQETTAEAAIRGEHQRQAADQVSVANAITSLRLCSALDWRQYVESVSLVEHVLQRDPAGAYGRMDFLSRDRQRQAVEELAAPNGDAQVRVALRAVESARQAAASGSPPTGPPTSAITSSIGGGGTSKTTSPIDLASRAGRDVSCSRTRHSSTWRR